MGSPPSFDGAVHDKAAPEFCRRVVIAKGAAGIVAGVTKVLSEATLSPTELKDVAVTRY